MHHQPLAAGYPAWERRYRYAYQAHRAGESIPESNRLLRTSIPSDGSTVFSAEYQYSEASTNNAGLHGSMTRMPHLPAIHWDYADRMQRCETTYGGGGNVCFTYDASGQRVRKAYEHSGLREERIYLGGYEMYRRVRGTGSAATLEVHRTTLHVMDDQRRVAMVENTIVDIDHPALSGRRWRLQLDNHLGTATVEVDHEGNVISYEEYHPYGTSALRVQSSTAGFSQKRYRYTGKERDEETGLYYHGARYYAPWLGRWTAADPLGVKDGVNVYQGVHCNPIGELDPDGCESQGGADEPIYQGNVTIDGAEYRQYSSFDGEFVWQEPVDAGTNSSPEAASPRVAAPQRAVPQRQEGAPRWLRDYMAEQNESAGSSEAEGDPGPSFRDQQVEQMGHAAWDSAVEMLEGPMRLVTSIYSGLANLTGSPLVEFLAERAASAADLVASRKYGAPADPVLRLSYDEHKFGSGLFYMGLTAVGGGAARLGGDVVSGLGKVGSSRAAALANWGKSIWSNGIANDIEWATLNWGEKVSYEIGQVWLRVEPMKELIRAGQFTDSSVMATVSRGRWMMENWGVSGIAKRIAPFSAKLETGLTPLLRWLTPRAGAATQAGVVAGRANMERAR